MTAALSAVYHTDLDLAVRKLKNLALNAPHIYGKKRTCGWLPFFAALNTGASSMENRAYSGGFAI